VSQSAPPAVPVQSVQSAIPAAQSAASPDAPPGDLAAELAAIREARRALASGQASSALGLVEAYERRFAHPALGPEATVLRIESLIALGRTTEARGLASRLLAEQPNTPYAQRVRSLLSNAP
jgi:hypothetical protein